jgi:hypothetical protein
MKWFAYGHDFGNSQMSGALSGIGMGEPVTRSIPTAIAKVDLQAMINLGINVEAPDYHTLRLDGEESSYAIGELALQQGGKSIWHGRDDIHRYASKQSVRAMLTVASTLIPDRDFGLYVVTGLPTETFTKNAVLRETIKQELSGTYLFTTDHGKSYRSASIEVATVVMEGAGALIYYGHHATGQSESAVIDIGGRTTDLYVARSQAPQIEYCKGRPLGVETAAELIKTICEQKYECSLTNVETRDILHAYASNDLSAYPKVSVYGKAISPLSLAKLAKEAVEETGSEILSYIASAWNENDQGKVGSRFSPLLNIGGGVFYFYSMLKARIPHLSRPADPVHANALGYCTLASYQLAKQAHRVTA